MDFAQQHGEPTLLTWDWYAATLAAAAYERVDSRDVVIEGEKLVGTNGFLASIVAPKDDLWGNEPNQGYHSNRDSTNFSKGIRVSLEHLVTPRYHKDDFDTPHYFAGCDYPACLLVLPTFDARIRWPDMLRERFRGGILTVDTQGAPVVRLGRRGQLVKSILSESFLEMAENPVWRFLSPVEPGRRLASLGLDRPGLFLASAGSRAARPLEVVSSENGLGTAASDRPLSLIEDAPGRAAVELPVGSRAAYSASSGSVYIVGGGDPSDLGTIRTYDLGSGRWSRSVPEEYQPHANVLGLALDPVNGFLYVLDEDKDEANARLVRHDLRQRSSRLLWEVPVEGTYRQVSLSVDEYSNLVLVGAGENAYTVWHLRVGAEGITFDGVFERAGLALDVPSMAMDSLVIPVQTIEQGIALEAVQWSAFDEGVQPCSRL